MPDLPGITVAKGAAPLQLLPRYANRHGLIAGATGTGKTVTLQVLAEGMSACGVPVFLADVKGDLAGLSQAGEAKPKIQERLAARREVLDRLRGVAGISISDETRSLLKDQRLSGIPAFDALLSRTPLIAPFVRMVQQAGLRRRVGVLVELRDPEVLPAAMPRGEVQGTLKMKYSDQEPFLATARRVEMKKLTAAIKRLAQTDVAIKTSLGGGGPEGGGGRGGGAPDDGSGRGPDAGPSGPDADGGPGGGRDGRVDGDEPGFDWAAMPELELGPGGIGTTPVWPHKDAS